MHFCEIIMTSFLTLSGNCAIRLWHRLFLGYDSNLLAWMTQNAIQAQLTYLLLAKARI